MKISLEDWKFFEALLSELELVYGAEKGIFLEKSPRLREAIESYIPAFLAINDKVNLTSITEPREVLWKHFFDSFLVLKLRPEGVLLDWGTGGGFPGVPLVFFRKFIEESEAPVILLDGREKKVRVIEELLASFGDFSAEFVHGRGEEFIEENDVDAVLMRAVAPPEKLLLWLDSRVKNWFFFTTPEQLEAWGRLSSKISARGLKFAQKLEDPLPFSMGKRNILHFQSK